LTTPRFCNTKKIKPQTHKKLFSTLSATSHAQTKKRERGATKQTDKKENFRHKERETQPLQHVKHKSIKTQP